MDTTTTTGTPAPAKVRTMSLPVRLSEDDVALRAQELATAEKVLTDSENRLESFVESAKGTKKKLETEIDTARYAVGRLAEVVRERRELREVPIVEDSDFEKGAVNTVRTDTGEIVSTRGMTQEERQRSLFEAKNKRGAKPAGDKG